MRRKATVSKEKTAEETRQKAAKMTQKKTAQKKAPQQKKNDDKKAVGKRTGAGSRKLKIIPLGGIGEVGKNMTVVEWQNNILVIDCGMMFPKEEMLSLIHISSAIAAYWGA